MQYIAICSNTGDEGSIFICSKTGDEGSIYAARHTNNSTVGYMSVISMILLSPRMLHPFSILLALKSLQLSTF